MLRILKAGLYVLAVLLILWYVADLLTPKAINSAQMHRPVGTPYEPPRCSPELFEIKDLTGRAQYEYLVITARITNGCPIAAGVEISTSVFDSRGKLIDTNSSWPASIRNIPAGATESFKVMMQPPQTRNITFTVVPVATKAWRN